LTTSARPAARRRASSSEVGSDHQPRLLLTYVPPSFARF
jgi:hypothetical protein